jgi:hypothetical protein
MSISILQDTQPVNVPKIFDLANVVVDLIIWRQIDEYAISIVHDTQHEKSIFVTSE